MLDFEMVWSIFRKLAYHLRTVRGLEIAREEQVYPFTAKRLLRDSQTGFVR